jgi:hypothetical protein
MGTVYAPVGDVVYGTCYAYPAWVGSVWYPAPITYGIGATIAYSTWGGWNVGFGIGNPVYPPYWAPMRTARDSRRACSPAWRSALRRGAGAGTAGTTSP